MCLGVISTEKPMNLGLWYFDCGCSRHMTGTKDFLKSVVLQDTGLITYGSGTQGKVLGKGVLDIEGIPSLRMFF